MVITDPTKVCRIQHLTTNSQRQGKPGPESNVLAHLSATISQVQGNNQLGCLCIDHTCFESSLYLNHSLRHLHETDINQHKTTCNTQGL